MPISKTFLMLTFGYTNGALHCNNLPHEAKVAEYVITKNELKN